jgi:hypothetical protein
MPASLETRLEKTLTGAVTYNRVIFTNGCVGNPARKTYKPMRGIHAVLSRLVYVSRFFSGAH